MRVAYSSKFLRSFNKWSFLITYKIRVIFVFENSDVLFINIGDHSIYRK